MNMKCLKVIMLWVMCVLFTLSMHAQQSEVFVPRTNVKLSALAAIGIVNPAVEFRVDEKWSVQLEGMGVFAAENFLGTGYPLQMGAAFVEARWYPKGVFRKFFLAPNVGGGAFRMNKNILHKFFGWAPDLDYKKPEHAVQIGHNFMGGVTLGYVFTCPKNPHWSIEANWSFGRQGAKYESNSHKGDELV